MPAVAITDHGTMYGVIEFFNAATSAGVKPIIGIEAYLAARGMRDRDPRLDKSSTHLLLLAENETGYRNLLQIASAAQLDGFYYHPRTDHEFLAAHSEGLIATSGCMAAEIPRLILERGLDSARQQLDWYYNVFGKDNFYLELQQHDIKELETINKALLELGPRYQARYIATNDVHYVNPGDARYQDILLAIQTGSLLTDPNRMRMSDNSYYLRPPDEMASLFKEVPEALHNTLLIAERVNVDLSTKGYHLPLFEVPVGYTPQTYLRSLCEVGLLRRYSNRNGAGIPRERLEYELGVIHTMGFDAYFLIVWDLCRYAQEHGIWYNARGSAAGSIVAYTLSITNVEPLAHGLIFERFLNPERVSMPDIDLDFQDDKRSKMLEYCAHQYGDDRVAQIITFGTMGARAAIRDVGRVMAIPLREVDRISKMIPNIPGKSVAISEALEQVTELKDLYHDSPYLKELIDTAAQMEGSVRSAGTHAAGVIITDKPIIEYLPLHRPTSNAEETPIKTVTQFEMTIVDSLGLLKVDFLGLATLTIMQRACDLINERHSKCYNLENIPIDDPSTYELLGKGHTAGVFQLESSGMTRYLVQMKPQNLANVIAMVALHRPGPLESIPSYIKRMHGEEKVTYRHPALQPILEETYGITIYQEQIMRAAVELASYTMSESDDFRKVIAKKQTEKLEKHRNKFIKGAIKNGIPEVTAKIIFEDWEEFANYGFNKSHAADYGIIAVQTAYLKAHYPVEYMSALLSASKNETEKVAFYVADCRSMGIEILPPDIHTSNYDFTIEDRADKNPAIRFGMGAVKNIGSAPVDLLREARKDGPFKNLNDFARRADLQKVGKRVLECLTRVGALDQFGPRKALLQALDQIISVSTSHFRAINNGQLTFFGAIPGVEESIVLPNTPSLDQREQLEWERELIGLYVSDHPLTQYLPTIQRRVTHFSGQLAAAANNERVCVAGLVTRLRSHQTKKGDLMAFITLEDIQGVIELVVFPRVWNQFSTLVSPGQVVLAEGRLDNANSEPKVLVQRFSELFIEVDENGQGIDPNLSYLPEEENREWVSSFADEPVPGQPSLPARPGLAQPAEGDDLTSPLEPDDWHLLEPPAPYVDKNPADTETPPPSAQTSQLSPPAKSEPGEMPPAALRQVDPPPPVGSPPVSNDHLRYLIAPLQPGASREEGGEIRMVKVILRASDDKSRDVRRLRRVHGILRSMPGKDKFAVLLFEGGKRVLIEFPNETTGICPELFQRLTGMVGEGNVVVETIKLQ